VTRSLAADDPLSPREREVVDLVVEGLTNQAVAARLYLSERTVESHVRAGLMKLGCRNRAELVRHETAAGRGPQPVSKA
jgi:DNA-binding NarL/FixJ family response regulator